MMCFLLLNELTGLMHLQPIHQLLKTLKLSRFMPTLTDYSSRTKILVVSNRTELYVKPVRSRNECFAQRLSKLVPQN